MCAEPRLITGDFNIHVDIQDDPCTSRFMELLESLGLEQRVYEPTYGSNHTMDLILVRKVIVSSLIPPNNAFHLRPLICAM